MNDIQVHKINEWVTDVDEKSLSPAQALYLKNREFFDTMNSGVLNGGSSMAANYEVCELQTPAGETFSVGRLSSIKTNEVYVIVYNSNAVNFIYRIGQDGCEIVYQEDCLSLSAEPQHSIESSRIGLDVKKTCKNWGGKRLVFGNTLDYYCIDIEASIATNGFTTDFFKDCTNPCDLVKLCVPSPKSSLKAFFIPRTQADALLPNKIADRGFQLMYRWEYYDGRRSGWSDVSTMYLQNDKGCFQTSEGSARCMKIRIPVGNAMVAYVELAYRNDNQSDFVLYERIAKYKAYNNAQQQWYERQLSELITSPDANYSTVDCAFDYIFCNDKQTTPLPGSANLGFKRFPKGAQGFTFKKNQLLFFNFVKGNCPLDRAIPDNMKIERQCTTNTCSDEFVEVKIRAVFHNFLHNRNQCVYVADENENGDVQFGGINDQINGGFKEGSSWGQIFTNPVKNLIVYVEGEEEIFVEMKQFKSDAFFRNTSAQGVIINLNKDAVANAYRKDCRNGIFRYQEGTIKIRKGKRGFVKLTNHKNTGSNPNESTYLFGTIGLGVYKGNLNINNEPHTRNKEIYFDTCSAVNGKLDITEAFVIQDNAVDAGGNAASSVYGYVKDCNGSPAQGVMVNGQATDSNGFYNYIQYPGTNTTINLAISYEDNCNNYIIKQNVSVDVDIRSATQKDIEISDPEFCNNYYSVVKQKVIDCVTGLPLAGVKVAINDGKTVTTNSNGEAIFRIRNNSTRNRKIKTVLLDNNGCFGIDCFGNCNQCMPISEDIAQNCFKDRPEVNLPPMKVNTAVISKGNRFLASGGRFGFAFIAEGDCGNQSFVNKGTFIDIPKRCADEQTCIMNYDMGNSVFLSNINRVKMVRTKNLNPFLIECVIDKAEYRNGKIILTIQSLNDYYFDNLLQVNTIYQYLKGDRLEFIKDEAGVYYCNSLNYQILSPLHDKIISGQTIAEANYFNQLLIEDDGRIGKTIKEGTVIRLQRPVDEKAKNTYYSIGVELSVVNGLIVNPIGTFETFDTYLVNRRLGKFADTFEHHSPSDFWGDHISDIGRPYIENEYEDEKRYGRLVTLSDADDFSSFSGLEQEIGDVGMGDIVSVGSTDDKALLFIFENDNKVAETVDDLLRIRDGFAVSAPSGEIINDNKISLLGRYGCQYEDIGSIYYGDGYVTWADVNRHAYIIHDYNYAKEASLNKIGQWCTKRFQQMRTWNNALPKDDPNTPLNKFRFSTGWNQQTGMVYLTLKQLRQSGINNDHYLYDSSNETICYHPLQDKFYGMPSFTPEGYANINAFNGKGCAYLTILNGVAWMHPMIPEKWGEFYGVPVDEVVEICSNKEPQSIKIWNAFEGESNMMWFVERVITDKQNFRSEIPPARIEVNQNGKFNGAFLGNINSREGLDGDEKPTGYWAKITFVRDNTDNLKYLSIDNSKRILFDEMDLIITKFFLSEQSGFGGNI